MTQPSHVEIIVTGAATDAVLGEYYWVEWEEGALEIALNCTNARGRRVWRNTRGMESQCIFAIRGKVMRPQ